MATLYNEWALSGDRRRSPRCAPRSRWSAAAEEEFFHSELVNTDSHRQSALGGYLRTDGLQLCRNVAVATKRFVARMNNKLGIVCASTPKLLDDFSDAL